jgi:hypothetical protein
MTGEAEGGDLAIHLLAYTTPGGLESAGLEQAKSKGILL